MLCAVPCCTVFSVHERKWRSVVHGFPVRSFILSSLKGSCPPMSLQLIAWLVLYLNLYCNGLLCMRMVVRGPRGLILEVGMQGRDTDDFQRSEERRVLLASSAVTTLSQRGR